ncbi:MAG: Fe-S cluster assembly protein SufD [Candidatus Contendobacter sp.]|jgi:Fe-S cluster assembly protein SufD|nr:Fe-S cluster assembly protein SufD [Gammaproteobacteria bacterium]MCC8993973.1 Fe-S cluster assembly protein SufD [Candidatus Contendobacter sp.]
MTAIAPLLSDPYHQSFAAFMAERREPEFISRLRQAAFARFETLGWPTRRQEAWRFTDLSDLQALTLQRPSTALIDAAALPSLEIPTHRLVFVNGRLAPGLSQVRELPERAMIAGFSQALPDHSALIEPVLDSLPGLQSHPFAALNTAFWEDGALIYLPRNAVIEEPIHLVFYATGGDMAVYPRLFLMLEQEAQATVVVECRGQGSYCNAPLAELQLSHGATLHYHQVQEESPQAFHLSGIRVRQSRASQTQLHLFSSGGQLARTDLEVLLDGEQAECLVNGLTLGQENQTGDYHLRIEHAQPHGTSEQVFKSVLEGKSRSVFDGMIHVRKHAQKTDARQTNRNLLLSRHAQAHANPRLEILADDVKCGHGSSTGFLDPDAEFYLRARGIPLAQARALLVHAFAKDSLTRIALTPLRERLDRVLATRLALDSLEGN